MKVFEFYFNPRAKKNRIFKTFASSKEKGLYLVGEISNVLPHNARFLNRLFLLLEKEYQNSSSLKGKERIKETLKKGNEFLAKESAKGNTDWLGNLHCAVLFFSAPKRSLPEVYLAKTGSIKVYIGRNERIIDIEKSIQGLLQRHPAHALGNIISGKLLPGDKLFVFNKELYETLEKQKLLKECITAKGEIPLKNLFKSKQKELKKTQGILFSLFLEGPQTHNRFSLLTLPALALPEFPFSLPGLSFTITRNTLLFGLLFLLLFGGMFLRGKDLLFSGERRAAIEQITSLKEEATSALSRRDGREAFLLLREALNIASEKEITGLKKEIEDALLAISNRNTIDNPDLFFEIPFKEIGLVPDHMTLSGNSLYLSNSANTDIYVLDIRTKQGNLLKGTQNLRLATNSRQGALFFAEPRTLFQVNSDTIQKKELESPYPEFKGDAMAAFESNVYFWDSRAKEIVRYPLAQGLRLQARLWFHPSTKKKPETNDHDIPLAIDRNIWIVSNRNELERYLSGLYQETLDLLVFPEIKEISALYARSDLSSLYLLDAAQKRVVVISKNGLIETQYESPHFDNLLSLQVSSTGSVMYILNGSKVYKIEK